MAAEEQVGGKTLLHVAQRIAGDVTAAVCRVQHGGAFLPLDQHDILKAEETDAAPVMEHHAALYPGPGKRRTGRLRRCFRGSEQVPRPLQRLHHPLHLEGLHQIVEGVYLESVAHVALVGRSEDQQNGRVHVLNDSGAFHAGHFGHFYIQKNHVRPQGLRQLDGLFAIGGFPGQREAVGLFDQPPQDHPHSAVVVRDQYPQIAVHPRRPHFRWPGRVRISFMTTPCTMARLSNDSMGEVSS